MPARRPRRRRRRAGSTAQAGGDAPRTMHVHAAGDVYVDSSISNRSSVSSSTVSYAPDRASLADDLMPAVLTALPLLLVLLLLSLTGQHVLLRSILQEGNPLGLTALLLPLFLPTIAASLVYLARQRGWLGWTRRATNWAAAGLAAGFAIFVPMNYLLLQLIAFLVSLGWIWARRRLARHRRGIAIVAIVMLAALVVEEGLAESGWPRYSLSRIAVGRVVDGLTRLNLEDADAKTERSVLVVSVNDGYAIVASTGYPPRMESMAPSELAGGRICQLRLRGMQLSLFQWIGTMVPASRRTPPVAKYCVDP
ncbi:hypothetical protein [Micromonospora chersina]|uniref:hypothetical protein n=1 Tax=Micromonospora chersina TaxID=47854 RepID=UPI0037177D61